MHASSSVVLQWNNRGLYLTSQLSRAETTFKEPNTLIDDPKEKFIWQSIYIYIYTAGITKTFILDVFIGYGVK